MSRSERTAGSARHHGGRRLRALAPLRRPCIGGAAASLLLALCLLTLPAAPAAAQEACAGVTVVVDFGPLAPGPATGCAVDPANGLDALAGAGFSVTEVASIRGMVCRIDDLPETGCGGSPPADAYWSYWHAEPGDAEWTYAMVGGADASPDAGDLEGWAFGDGSAPPALTPAEAAATPTAETPDGGASADEGTGPNRTWILAVAALALIVGIVVGRVRHDRRP
ncbi:hypothetical protein [Glycomyces sp. NRRL B-16210]|uniref:hypothetical protein n=1 Tax=Glycomyces sp. NRRL B-16210 TaxID=1463821 RepID=UPI00068FB819|nr:hypothetical protein [Glycomyces sp. NRRL B-16210]